jgi:hypothetical protein
MNIVFILFFVSLTAFAPACVYYQDRVAARKIDNDELIEDQDFATSYYYVDYCQEHGLTSRKLCKQSKKALERYRSGVANVKVLGF